MLPLVLDRVPRLDNGTMLIALTGWMDGGLVSTGTVRHFMHGRAVSEIGHVETGGFFLDAFPGSMDMAAVFRPEVTHVGGLVTKFESRSCKFSLDADAKLVFFVGGEPNLNWEKFADCIIEAARRLGVKRLVFIGSFGGTVPHTREPRLFGSVSDASLLHYLEDNGIRPSDYSGPASFSSYLCHRAPAAGLEFVSVVAEIPGYLNGANPTSIAAVARRVASVVGVAVDLEPLRRAGTDWELRVSEVVAGDEELATKVRGLEEAYDNELIGKPTPVPADDDEEENESEEESDD